MLPGYRLFMLMMMSLALAFTASACSGTVSGEDLNSTDQTSSSSTTTTAGQAPTSTTAVAIPSPTSTKEAEASALAERFNRLCTNSTTIEEAIPYVSGAGDGHSVAMMRTTYDGGDPEVLPLRLVSSEPYRLEVADGEPAAGSDVDLVACISETRSELQACDYTMGRIVRYQYEWNTALRSAQTAEVISSTTISGSLPRECREREELPLRDLGGPPSPADVAQWIEGVVGNAWAMAPGPDGDSRLNGQMRSVIAGGPGFVAVGYYAQGGAAWTSTDGTSWSRVFWDQEESGWPSDVKSLTSVTLGESGFVAVGWAGSPSDEHAAVFTSVDGVTWARVPHQESVFGGAGHQRMRSVAVGGPGFVAVGSDDSTGHLTAAVWTSADGIAWQRVPHQEAVFGGSGFTWMSSVIAGGPGLVGVGAASDGAAVWTSVDGTTWQRVPEQAPVFGGPGTSMRSVTASEVGLVAVGWERLEDYDAAVWTSSDGITWSRSPVVLGNTSGSDERMEAVSTDGTGLVAVGSASFAQDLNAAVWMSRDGSRWDPVPDVDHVFGFLDDDEMFGVAASGTRLVAVGSSGADLGSAAWYSDN